MIDDTDYGQHTHREVTMLRQERDALKAKIDKAIKVAHDLENYPYADSALDYIAELLSGA